MPASTLWHCRVESFIFRPLNELNSASNVLKNDFGTRTEIWEVTYRHFVKRIIFIRFILLAVDRVSLVQILILVWITCSNWSKLTFKASEGGKGNSYPQIFKWGYNLKGTCCSSSWKNLGVEGHQGWPLPIDFKVRIRTIVGLLPAWWLLKI